MTIPIIQTAILAAGLSLAQAAVPDANEAARVYQAVRTGGVVSLKELLAQGISVNHRDSRGESLLMQSAVYGSVDTLKFLLERGAEVNATNHAGATALMRAAGNHEKIKLLVARGANVNVRSTLGNTPLILAARPFGSAKSVEILLNAGAEINATNSFGASALMAAAASGDLDTVRLLVRRGADVNAHARGSEKATIWGGGRSALGWAAFRGDRDMAKFLIQSGADVNSQEGFGSALSQAIWADRTEAAQFLLKNGADVVQADFFSGFTPLHWAAYSEHRDPTLVEAILKKGANPNAGGGEVVDAFMGVPQTPLMIAKKRGDTPIVKSLLASGANAKPDRDREPAATNDRTTDLTTLRAALTESIPPLIETARFSKGAFVRHSSKQDCVSCHQQYLPLTSFAFARLAGAKVDQGSEAEVLNMVQKDNENLNNINIEATFHPEPVHGNGYALLSLAAQQQPPDARIDAAIHHLLVIQGKDGQWYNNLPRPPMQSSDIGATALAISALQKYGFPGRRAEIDERIERARKWLRRAKPGTNEERAYQLLGLVWAGERPEKLRKFAQELFAEQRADGGWAQLPALESDAYATGLTLFSLIQSSVPRDDSHVQRGLAFLLKTQAADGTWHVRTRAFPFQPTMRSGFPYSRDSWISATGSSWAAIAIGSALQEQPIHLSAR